MNTVEMMDQEAMKYSRIEYERRFLVSPDTDWQSFIEPYSKTFEDKYTANGNKLSQGFTTKKQRD